MDVSNIELEDENSNTNTNQEEILISEEYGFTRIDEIKKLLMEDYKLYKRLSQEPGLISHPEEYDKKRADLLSILQKL